MGLQFKFSIYPPTTSTLGSRAETPQIISKVLKIMPTKCATALLISLRVLKVEVVGYLHNNRLSDLAVIAFLTDRQTDSGAAGNA